MSTTKKWFWVAGLVSAILFDFLFWKKPFGISFVIWITVVLGAGYLLAWKAGRKPAAISLLLSVLILGFTVITAWRNEPFTQVFNFLLAAFSSLLLTATFLNGNWVCYRMVDYLSEMTRAVGGAFSRAFSSDSKKQPPQLPDQGAGQSFFKKALPVLRGLLIALPIVALLSLLLSSADPVFGDWLKQILNLDQLPEDLFRLFYIVVITVLLVGIYLHAILPTREAERPDPQKAWMKPFLGWTETAIILGAVDVLFMAFVFIQIRYLFGGTANITETGYTYSEYARRGFSELVAVAVLSLLLYLCLNTIGKHENRRTQTGFSVLSVLLMANVLVILASSLQRLMLYEDAYGFSRLRTYTHVCIFWLGGLILAAVLLELYKKRGHFALALLISLIGFGSTLAVINVDAFIAGKNIERSIGGKALDIQYLTSLSEDAVPLMVEKYGDSTLPDAVKTGLGASLACRQAVMEDPAKQPWQSFNLGETKAYRLLQEHQNSWSEYEAYNDFYSGWTVRVDGGELHCFADPQPY